MKFQMIFLALCVLPLSALLSQAAPAQETNAVWTCTLKPTTDVNPSSHLIQLKWVIEKSQFLRGEATTSHQGGPLSIRPFNGILSAPDFYLTSGTTWEMHAPRIAFSTARQDEDRYEYRVEINPLKNSALVSESHTYHTPFGSENGGAKSAYECSVTQIRP